MRVTILATRTESSRLAEEAAKAVAKQENNVKLGLHEVSMCE